MLGATHFSCQVIGFLMIHGSMVFTSGVAFISNRKAYMGSVKRAARMEPMYECEMKVGFVLKGKTGICFCNISVSLNEWQLSHRIFL